jgi:ABC-type multidrug transport system fused ATPase/permease subunit
MVCVERVLEYSKVESEADLSKVTDQQLVNWPKSGNIEVKNLSIRYRSTLPLSLSRASFSIKSGQKIGVVGRTGSGKSTLVQALCRILEAETGSIAIDGVDISTIGLHKLRMGMSVISQYPVLFSGCTVRENLDPFEQHSDGAIKEALSDVQMTNVIGNLSEGLQFRVSEGGFNFSVGERQLLCLARATLQKSRILILDEPTANVDSRTDQLLQKAVKKSFSEATVISIAHRLDTIIDNDVVLVLGAGKVLEFDSPHNLIEKNGHFAKMVNDTGAEMSDELRRRAQCNSK